MNVLGFELSLRRKSTSSVSNNMSGWMWGGVRDWFPGAWQRNITPDKRENLLAFSAVFACISLIAEDIAKLRPRLMEQKKAGNWSEVDRASPLNLVLRKPNSYQTRIQFFIAWLVMKLLYGNAYVVKERDARGVVRALYVLDSRHVTPLVADDGSVFYRISRDPLSGLTEETTIPESEMIHDRGLTLFHPLIGVSPIFACGASATQGIRIQNNSERFFDNMSRPSGHLTSPGTISDTTAERLKTEFEKNFSGGNLGRLLVTGDALKYEAMTIPASDAQLIEQLKWTVEDVARCFRVPLHKIASGQNPTFTNIGAMNQDYYSQTLQTHIEAIELLLDEGLGLLETREHTYGVEFDLEGLLRMDPLTRADVAAKQSNAGIISPNEARIRENLPPVAGGDTPYLQQQNWSLAALDRRDKREQEQTPALPAPTPAGDNVDTQGEMLQLTAHVVRKLINAEPATC